MEYRVSAFGATTARNSGFAVTGGSRNAFVPPVPHRVSARVRAIATGL